MTETLIAPAATPTRRFAAWDLVLTIAVIVLTGAFLVITAFVDFFSALLVGTCSSLDCRPGTAVAALGISWFSMLVVGVVGAIVAIVLLVKRRRAWWVALLALVLVIAGWVAGFLFYTAAVGSQVGSLHGFSAIGSLLA
jgi:hypothetical protein